MNFFFATVAYEGTHYWGWQKARGRKSIQEEISIALRKLSCEDVIPEAASRTDKGVHARGQSIAFGLKKEITPYRLLKALNAHLSPDIRILEINETTSDFHPTIDAQGKEYRYYLSLGPFQSPMDRLYAWHIPQALDIAAMKDASQELLGTHDFSAFSTKESHSPLCTLSSIDFIYANRKLEIHLKGNRFLYKMARTLVGTLVEVGKGKTFYFNSKKRESVGMTAPAHGLFLHRVVY